MLRLMPYKFKIVHRGGADNIADYLSRHPLPANPNEFEHEEMADKYINHLAKIQIPSTISRKQLIDATNKDFVLA